MEWLNNIKIRTKLIIGFIIVAFIAGIVGFIGIAKINETDKNYTELYINYGIAISDIADVSISYQRMRINVDNIIMDKENSNRRKYEDKIRAYDKNIQESLIKFEKSIQTDDGRNELSNLKALLDNYNSIKEDVINLALENKEEDGLALMKQDATQNIADQINNSVDNLFKLKESGGFDKSDQYSLDVHSAVTTMIIVIAIAMSIALLLGIVISKLISKPVLRIMDVTGKISDGNLDVEIVSDSRDEIGLLSESVKKMLYKLNQVLGHMSFAAEQVTVGSKQIAESTISLSQGATEQASAVEELTASIEEISAQIKMNAENAKKATNIANSTKINAIKRNDEMKLMVDSMDEINISSNNISKIIKVIDEIAFQTNILALNAAIEAARAGKYGNGFTVVAEEVRNLAARSANAAKETTEIIEKSIIKIGDGTKIANKTAYELNNIVKDIQEVAGLISNISEASEEQAIGIEQISQGVVQISQVIQSNSASAEQGAAASEELAGQADDLKEQVQMFNLKNGNNSNFNLESNNTKANKTIKQENIKKNKKSLHLNDIISNKKKPKAKEIILSDNEFGKY